MTRNFHQGWTLRRWDFFENHAQLQRYGNIVTMRLSRQRSVLPRE